MKNQRLPDVPDSLCSDFIEQTGKLFPGDSSTIYVYCHRYWSKGITPPGWPVTCGSLRNHIKSRRKTAFSLHIYNLFTNGPHFLL